MKTIPTVCARDCYDSCFMQAMVASDGRLVSVWADDQNPITAGFLCPRGNRDAKRVYRNRIKHPHLRSGTKPERAFRRVTWQTALASMATKIQSTLAESGPESVLLLNYGGNMGLLAEVFPERLWRHIGATRTDGGLCSRSGHAALRLHFGRSYGLQPVALCRQKVVLFWGFNPAISAPHIWHLAVKARKEEGAVIAVIDPRQTETARRADLWLAPRPGTDAALAQGIAQLMIENNWIDRPFISRWTHGFSDYSRAVAKWSLDRTADETGLASSQIDSLAQLYSHGKPGAIAIGIGFQKAVGGAEAVRAVALLTVLSGQHRGFLYGNGDGYGVDKQYLSGASQSASPGKVVSQVGLGRRLALGQFKFVFIYGANPLLTLPDQTRVRKGLTADDVYTVVHDTHWTETADYADLVLPAASFLEKDDLVVPWSHNHVRKSKQVLPAAGESRTEVELMTTLAKKLSVKADFLFEDPWLALEKAFTHAVADGGFARLLKGQTEQLLYPPLDHYPTPSTKIELAASIASGGISPTPLYTPPVVPKDQFVLLNSAVRRYTHTQFQDIFGPIPAVVWINPADAAIHGLKDKERIEISNDVGRTQGQLFITDRVPQGVLWTPRQFPGDTGQPMNNVTSSEPQRLGGGSVFNSTVVGLGRVVEDK